MKRVLLATSANPPFVGPGGKFDFWGAVEGVLYLYTRPWFRRLWVQQEIFAARKVKFQYGNHCFEWSRLLSEPTLLRSLPRLRPESQLDQDGTKVNKNLAYESRDEIIAQWDAISNLDEKRMQNLRCFNKFSATPSQRPYIVDALLDTGLLNATNARDYIYGIVGMTGFAAKPMKLKHWLTARQSELFIPIDYSADMVSIMCAATWVILMKAGLAVLVKFKAFTTNYHGICGKSLPSWVIDWRLSARLFGNIFRATSKDRKAKKTVSHLQFRKDNQNPDHMISHNQLVLRGTPDSRFYIKSNSVWEKRLLRGDKIAWRLECDIHTTDLLVRMHAFFSGRGGLWLLRPLAKNGYKLIACLLSRDGFVRYNWRWGSILREHGPPEGPQLSQCRSLEVYPVKYMGVLEALTKEERDPGNARTYIIV